MVTAISRPVVCPVLIGREPYLAALDAALDRARAGEGQAVLISGEAGIGKTRLLAELAALAAARDVRVVRANCYEAERAVPFAPLLDLLRALASGDHEHDPGLAEALCRADPYLLSLAPGLALLLPEPPAAHPPLEPEQRQRRLFAALSDLLLGLARERPLLVAVEDAHWADDTSLEFLLHLARRLADAHVLLAVTYRSDELTPALRHALAELDRARLATEAPLAPLDEAGVAAMLRAIFGLDRPPSSDLLRALHGLTEGNPFFIEEVLHVLVAAGDIFYAGGRWDRKPLDELSIPRSVHDAVQRRALRLSPAAADALKLAAVLGRRFDVAVLQRVGGYDEPALLALLRELVAAQLLVEEPDDRVAFRHALTRRAVYAELLARERRALHRTVAESIERLAGDAGADADAYLADLAYHTFAAGLWEKALDYTRRVGERALALYAPGAAVEHFTRALEAADHLHAPAPLDVLRGRASAYETLGDFDRARADYERALALARDAADWRGEWRTLRDLGMLWSGRDYAQAGTAYRLAHEHAQASGDAPTLARSLNSLGNWLLNADEPREALRHHREALAVFESLGDRQGIAETLDFLGMASYLSGDLIAGTRYYERAVALLRELGERKLLSSALATMALRGMTWQTDTLVPAADLSSALAEGREGLEVAHEIGWSGGEAYAHFQLAYGTASHGDYAATFRHLDAGLGIAREIEHRQWLCALEFAHGSTLLDLLAFDEAQVVLTAALRLARDIGSHLWDDYTASFLSLCHVERGALTDAASVLDAALPAAAPLQALGQRLVWCARARLALARGDPAGVLALTDQLAQVPHARGPEDLPRVAWLRGQALAALRRYDEAERMLLAAARLAERHEARPLLWRARADLARLYLATGRRDEAERQVAAAAALIAELAANVPDASLRASFERGATASLPLLKPLPARRPADDLPGGLTAREREVTVLVALGRSNRAIAEQLVVSERTVETHVANILGKLGFNARAQIAAWAALHGLITPPPGG